MNHLTMRHQSLSINGYRRRCFAALATATVPDINNNNIHETTEGSIAPQTADEQKQQDLGALAQTSPIEDQSSDIAVQDAIVEVKPVDTIANAQLEDRSKENAEEIEFEEFGAEESEDHYRGVFLALALDLVYSDYLKLEEAGKCPGFEKLPQQCINEFLDGITEEHVNSRMCRQRYRKINHLAANLEKIRKECRTDIIDMSVGLLEKQSDLLEELVAKSNTSVSENESGKVSEPEKEDQAAVSALDEAVAASLNSAALGESVAATGNPDVTSHDNAAIKQDSVAVASDKVASMTTELADITKRIAKISLELNEVTNYVSSQTQGAHVISEQLASTALILTSNNSSTSDQVGAESITETKPANEKDTIMTVGTMVSTQNQNAVALTNQLAIATKKLTSLTDEVAIISHEATSISHRLTNSLQDCFLI